MSAHGDMGWALALILGVCVPLIAMAAALLVAQRRSRKRQIIRPEVGGCWKINRDWNVRSRR